MKRPESLQKNIDSLSISLVGLHPSDCQLIIKAWAAQLSIIPVLADAEAVAQGTVFDFGGYFRDLLHLLQTETQAALQVVERRHFESSFTSC